MKADVAREFRDPSARYRGKPFWAWNGRLDPEELRRQIGVMKRMGLGGFFMHSRTGLATPYLGEDWMNCVAACIDEARKSGMEAWLYDEDRWPSGAAGGLVTRDRRFRQRFLHCAPCASGDYRPDRKDLAAFAAVMDGDVLGSYRRLRGRARPANGERVLVFRVDPAPDSPWYNGAAYLDTLNPAAVHRFIETTHEAYLKRFGPEFGRTVPGIFTDEPMRGLCHVRGDPPWQLPWTGALPRVFRSRYGYDLIEHLPELFLDLEDRPVNRARWQYHDAVTSLFVESFARPIGDWCARHGLRFTGHVLAEATPSSQTGVVGAAMRFYEYMQAPGIDILTDARPEYDTAKQCASVVRQSGRRWMLSELYGCTGWDFPFEGHKFVGDWQAALGVNLRCHHLYWHTMLGQAKRDYPASIGHPSPWWRDYPHVEDYFARLNRVLSEGRPLRDLLVVHPIESTWARYAHGEKAGADIEALDRSMARVRDILLQGHIDFDYGDEEMLSRLGRVRRGKGGARFIVGEAEYTAMLLPPMRTIRSTTLALLRAFADAGGRVIVSGDAPPFVDAQPSPEAERLAADPRCIACPVTPRRLLDAAAPARRLRILGVGERECASVLYHLRDLGTDRALFLCTTDRRKAIPEARILLDAPDAVTGVEEWDAETGTRSRVPCRIKDGTLTLETSLPASGSRLFLLRREPDLSLPLRPALPSIASRPIRQASWPVQRDEPNVLVLDRATWRLGEGAWRPDTEILRIDSACRDALELPRRGGQMVQPWARGARSKGAAEPLELRFSFSVESLPAGPVHLAMEQPQRFRIRLNETPMDGLQDEGWWVDPSLRRLSLDPALFRRGQNRLDLCTDFERDHDLEALFLLGEFGVRTRGARAVMTARSDTLRVGDWTRQGLPFYSGSVTYTCRVRPSARKGQRLFLEVPRWAGACLRIRVDGRPAGVLAWPPYELDLSSFATRPAFTLGITVVGHRRNSHGPLHLRPYPRGGWIGPAEYVTEGAAWSEAWQLVPVGLLAPPRLGLRAAH